MGAAFAYYRILGVQSMMRLVKAGLNVWHLYQVSSPAMVERYNRALDLLIGKKSALTEFHIRTFAGYSPEIAHRVLMMELLS